MDRTVSPSGGGHLIFCAGWNLGAALRGAGGGHHHGSGHVPGRNPGNQCGAVQ